MINTPQEREAQAAKLLDTFATTLTRVAPKIDRDLHISERSSEEVSFNLDNYSFSLTWGETTRTSIGGTFWVVQFSLCIWHQTSGGRWNPPENVDTTLITSQSIYDCLRTAFETVAKEEIRCVIENDGYEQSAKEEAALEQA